VSVAALARIAHEFRSPLTAVLGFAEFLRAAAEDAPPERLRGYLDDLAAAAGRMRTLADDLVALGAAAQSQAVEEVALDGLAEAALRLAAPLAQARGARLAPPPRSGLKALADPAALGRALDALVDNAVRHGGGEIRVAARDLGRGAGAALEVSDDGAGLDAGALAAALEPYGRLSAAGQGAAGGLGLPNASEIAEAHGGALEIETAPGAGFTARLRLPAGRILRGG
jgi:signal transduction histidine kinase